MPKPIPKKGGQARRKGPVPQPKGRPNPLQKGKPAPAKEGRQELPTQVLTCTRLDSRGRGLCLCRGREIAVAGLLPGEVAEVALSRRFGEYTGEVRALKKAAPLRQKPPCPYADRCGGCQLLQLQYEGQLAEKGSRAEALLGRFGPVAPILSAPDPLGYRCKAHLAAGRDRGGRPVTGIYQEHSHRLVPVKHCLLHHPLADRIIATVRELMKPFKIAPFDEDTGEGFLRHILVRVGQQTGEAMVVLVAAYTLFPGQGGFVRALRERHPEIKTVVLNVNNRETSAVLGEYEKVLYGPGFIEDALCGMRFRISPRSFFQVNPRQTERLYTAAVEMAGLTGSESVVDAYCGIGTIGLLAAGRAKQVLGIERNRDAVRDAIGNARKNGVKNARFVAADAGEYLVQMAEDGQRADVVFMDPARAGSTPDFLEALAAIAPAKIVYISCNPETQQRDVDALCRAGYRVSRIQPVDMFPQTAHLECICLLER
ncbi:23S rRNA (uracil(1939)-C(5))-methyltransferase RlmD [Acetanaerobacterium sp. MSJ-12]|uniref:23S rRNA (uracil(1939)-C(5))-methyltransferase RlmD n=1 Tax=Acetanaerobacterium sp. MSJ-12 TaxID=2841535 RepID=UPI001C0EE85D|nr:23S rRNA (uracil(1939)-C(5))-methyltransferase RlmD [Acetanaerobacterium sp. MSJ-12]MBU5419264.1 23S rRNA (uracil(1939)-C(5))-methyltransferase RlmD [Acetanaerobacterium sp. MSJ-12]